MLPQLMQDLSSSAKGTGPSQTLLNSHTSHTVRLPSGAARRQNQDGHTLVHFSNGDCKRSYADGAP